MDEQHDRASCQWDCHECKKELRHQNAEFQRAQQAQKPKHALYDQIAQAGASVIAEMAQAKFGGTANPDQAEDITQQETALVRPGRVVEMVPRAELDAVQEQLGVARRLLVSTATARQSNAEQRANELADKCGNLHLDLQAAYKLVGALQRSIEKLKGVR